MPTSPLSVIIGHIHTGQKINMTNYEIFPHSFKAEVKACRYDQCTMKLKTSVREMTGRPHVLNLQVQYTRLNSKSFITVFYQLHI